ncbi:hypothetical protein Tco_0839704 [Tanacetum coccineum]|uniref:Uncharacterized protein n=1 Tax=Tanacetum coccineum TaxID=301880 RepID=A0ABQ5AU56_9ASTR
MREVDGTIEGKFSEHCGGNDGIGGSKFRVGEGKVVSMGGIRGGAFSLRRKSLRMEVGWKYENNSSMGSRLMERGDEKSRLEKLVEDLKYSLMEVRMVDREVMKFVALLTATWLTLYLAVLFKLALFFWHLWERNDENEVKSTLLLKEKGSSFPFSVVLSDGQCCSLEQAGSVVNGTGTAVLQWAFRKFGNPIF